MRTNEEIEKDFIHVLFVDPDGYVGFAYKKCLHKPGFYENCKLYGLTFDTGRYGEPILTTAAVFDTEKGWIFYDQRRI